MPARDQHPPTLFKKVVRVHQVLDNLAGKNAFEFLTREWKPFGDIGLYGFQRSQFRGLLEQALHLVTNDHSPWPRRKTIDHIPISPGGIQEAGRVNVGQIMSDFPEASLGPIELDSVIATMVRLAEIENAQRLVRQ